MALAPELIQHILELLAGVERLPHQERTLLLGYVKEALMTERIASDTRLALFVAADGTYRVRFTEEEPA